MYCILCRNKYVSTKSHAKIYRITVFFLIIGNDLKKKKSKFVNICNRNDKLNIVIPQNDKYKYSIYTTHGYNSIYKLKKSIHETNL